MNDAKYIGLDVHQATISVAVRDCTGKLVMEAIVETKAETILQCFGGLHGTSCHPPSKIWRCCRRPGGLGGLDHREVRGSRQDAQEWLLAQLSAGSVEVAKVQAGAFAAGIKAHTLRGAATSLYVEPGKLGFRQGWEWSLSQRG
jgi:hypothetical protein